MKKVFSLVLILGLMFILIGCGSSKNSNVKEFTEKLISPSTYERITYENIELNKYTDQCSSVFSEYCTENGFGTLMANRVPFLYQSIMNYNDIKNIKDIKIIETANEDKSDYTYLAYEVSYTLQSDEKNIYMKDYLVFNIVKEQNSYLINKVSVINGKSSVIEVYKNIPK